MQTIETTVYSASELQAQFPDAFRRAHDYYCRSLCDIPWQDETIESLKECISRAGLQLKDYSLGAYNRGNYITVRFPNDSEASELTGARAMAWLENNLLGPLRISYTAENRWKLSKYNQSYRSCGSPPFYTAGRIAPCPLTGYCADEDYLDALRKAIRDGDTLKEAFEGLADVCMRLLEADDEDQRTEDYFLEHAEANQWQFTEEGERFD